MIELLVTVAVIGILASLLMPALGRSKESARRVICANQLRQTQLALQIYGSDHDGAIPMRLLTTAWPAQLHAYLQAAGVLKCPTDRLLGNTNAVVAGELGLRSYVMNGLDDVYKDNLSDTEWKKFPKSAFVVRDALIAHPGETVSFGEKNSASSAFYLDLLISPDNYFVDLEERRHGGKGSTSALADSNYAWFDGSVHALKFGKSTCPINLWAVSDAWRTKASLCRPR